MDGEAVGSWKVVTTEPARIQSETGVQRWQIYPGVFQWSRLARAWVGKLRQERHVYSRSVSGRRASSVGAA